MRFVRYWLPVMGWMGVIFFLSGRESTQVSDTQFINFLFFKTLHGIEYAVLFVLYLRAIGVNNCAAAFFLTLMYAMTDEIHQLFVPTREGRLRDVIIDAIGAGGAWIWIASMLPKAPKKLQRLARKWEIG